MDNLLTIENLTKSYIAKSSAGKRTYIHAVDGVSLGIGRGETLGLVGESGCGKTTLGRSILRLVQPDSGRIIFDGTDITRGSMRNYRKRMQIIFQDPAGSLDPRSKICDIISEGLRVHRKDIGRTERNGIVAGLLDSVGLDVDSLSRYPHEFSGGQQQRIGIARALAVEPEFIVCDEPISALDVSYQAQIINLLEKLQAERSLTYLFISHDLAVVRHISDRIGVMYLGSLVELGSSNEIGLHAVHPYTRSLLAAIPVPDPRAALVEAPLKVVEPSQISGEMSGCRYRFNCPLATGICEESRPSLCEISPGHFCACHNCG